MHFLQESYEFVRKTQILQVCYSVEHFLQDSDNILQNLHLFVRNSYKKCDVLLRPKIRSRFSGPILCLS